MKQKPDFNIQTIKLIFTVILSFSITNIVLGQEVKKTKITNLNRVQTLKLDSAQAGVVVYYSKGYLNRAIKMSKRITNDKVFYKDSLGIIVKIKIALLDTADFAKAAIKGPPYGMPFVEDGLIIMPADTSTGAVKDGYTPFSKTTSKDIILNLKKAGFSYGDAVNNMVDLIALHEIGHTQVAAFGIRTRQPWFSEFMATYFGYAYMQMREPEMAAVWDNMTHTGFVGYKPKHTTLDVLNKLYAGVGSDNYVWYQNSFQERIREVYSKKGLTFIRLVREKIADPSFKPVTARELLDVLEQIEPGFIKWAQTIENVNKQ